jgi:large subunit ribosomal protein L29
MKVSEIRDLSEEELREKLSEVTQEQFNLRFQHGTGQLENTMRLGEVKRDIARIKTVLRELELQASRGA